MIIEMIINDNCDYHHLLIMAGAQSAEDNHDYLDDYNIRYMIIIYWSTTSWQSHYRDGII